MLFGVLPSRGALAVAQSLAFLRMRPGMDLWVKGVVVVDCEVRGTRTWGLRCPIGWSRDSNRPRLAGLIADCDGCLIAQEPRDGQSAHALLSELDM